MKKKVYDVDKDDSFYDLEIMMTILLSIFKMTCVKKIAFDNYCPCVDENIIHRER